MNDCLFMAIEITVPPKIQPVYKKRTILVSAYELEAFRKPLPEGHTYEGRRDIYPYVPLRHQTVESFARSP